MCPGTISGSSGTDDRLPASPHARAVEASAAEPPNVSDEAATTEAEKGVLFLLATVAIAVLVSVLLVRPLIDLVANAMTAFGVITWGPGDMARRAWRAWIGQHPASAFAAVVGAQLLWPILALLGALALRGSIRHRLGLVQPRGGWRVLGFAILLEFTLFVSGACAVAAMLPPGYEQPRGFVLRLAELLATTSHEWFVALLLAMSVLPAIGEELFFRGFMLRYLLGRWSPVWAVVIVGSVFALCHPPFTRTLALLPGCLWLGYLAWRCGSVLPGMALHFGTNAGALMLLRVVAHIPNQELTPGARLIMGAVAVVGFALSAWMLVLLTRWTRPTPVVPSPPPLR